MRLIQKLFKPSTLYKLTPITLLLSVLFFAIIFPQAVYYAFFNSPVDYQQGEMVRMMYIHVPSAWLALGIYSFISLMSFISLVWKINMSYIFASAAAPIGAIFALITLITGSIWGMPVWGTWWVWDARLTSMLFLFLLYIVYISITGACENVYQAMKPASAIALLGFVNVPIVKFSVDIWYSLHQTSSITPFGKPSIHPSMLTPLVLMFASFILYSGIIFLIRVNYLLKSQVLQNQTAFD